MNYPKQEVTGMKGKMKHSTFRREITEYPVDDFWQSNVFDVGNKIECTIIGCVAGWRCAADAEMKQEKKKNKIGYLAIS